MSDFKRYKCVRCGRDVWRHGSACNDCLSVDPLTVKALTPTRPERVEQPIPDDCPVPSAGARERHSRRGEPSCMACREHDGRGRMKRQEATA